jgi:hypothetical protein
LGGYVSFEEGDTSSMIPFSIYVSASFITCDPSDTQRDDNKIDCEDICHLRQRR